MTEHQQFALRAADGHDIQVQVWRPIETATQVIQILHGLGEHAERYSRFANAATARGCIVYCHDHRGHGKHTDQAGYFGSDDGWNRVIADADTVRQEIRNRHADLPVALIGHSMGSYIAQSYLIKHCPTLSSLILSASTWPSRPLLLLASALAKVEGWRLGAHRNSALLQRLGFTAYYLTLICVVNKVGSIKRCVIDAAIQNAIIYIARIGNRFCGLHDSNGVA